MENYLKRALEVQIMRYLGGFSVVGLTGPRQSGKSTLLRHLLPHYQYVTFDDFKNLNYFEEDPSGFMARYANQIIFDEAQRVPKLFQAIKLAVDQDRQNYGKFILTGSSQFSLVASISESLAGRMGLLSLLPLQYSEIPKPQRADQIIHGSYPELVQRHYRMSGEWYAAYFDTYVNKDVRQLVQVGDLRDFQRFVMLLAAQTVQPLVLSNYAKELGVSVPTIKRWVSVLEASYLIFLLPPYYKNYGKRLVKAPKVYFFDTGLVCYLTGVQTLEHYHQGPLAGALFETYIVSEFYKRELHQKTQAELFYFGEHGQTEVDLLIDRKTHKEVIEIKKSSTFKVKMIESIKLLLEPQDQGKLIYCGESFAYTDAIQVKHYQDELG